MGFSVYMKSTVLFRSKLKGVLEKFDEYMYLSQNHEITEKYMYFVSCSETFTQTIY